MINGTIMKYENKEKKYHIYVETIVEKKTMGRGKIFTMNMREITKVHRNRE